jgi:cytosine/adenosine deaminase-related metal-dependent hydrolase
LYTAHVCYPSWKGFIIVANFTLLLRLLFHILLYSTASAAQSSILFQGATAVISFNKSNETVQVVYNASVLVKGDTVASIFPASQKASIPANTTTIPCGAKIITPGFVDTHRHLWQSAYRTLGSNTSLAEYFVRYGELSQAKTVFTADDVYLGQLIGAYESLNAGVTSILDHSHHTWSNETAMTGLQASVDSGARVWWCFTFHNLTNATWASPYTRQEQVEDFKYISQYRPWRTSSTVSLGMAYDSFASGNDALVNQVTSLAL